MAEVFEGRCQCGDVAYRVTGESLSLFVCHCTECQRQSSSAFGMALWVRQSRVEVLSGSLTSWVRDTPGGRQMICRFCPVCGTRISLQMADREEVISIKPGTLNDTTWLRPVGHIWTQSAQPWVELGDPCLAYPGNPPGFESLVDTWQKMK